MTLPPGRASEATRPLPTGSPAPTKMIGTTVVTAFAASTATAPEVTMVSTLRRTNSAAISANCSLRPSAQRELDDDCAAFDPTEFAQSRYETGGPLRLRCRCGGTENPDGRQPRRLLRTRGERQRGCRTRKTNDKSASPH